MDMSKAWLVGGVVMIKCKAGSSTQARRARITPSRITNAEKEQKGGKEGVACSLGGKK
jgi:hypothetical protein